MCATLKWDIFWGNKSCILLVDPGCAKCSYPRLVVCVWSASFSLFLNLACWIGFYLSWCLSRLFVGLPCSKEKWSPVDSILSKGLVIKQVLTRSLKTSEGPTERKRHLAVIHAGLCWYKPVVTRDHPPECNTQGVKFLFFPIFWSHSYFLLLFQENLLFFLFFGSCMAYKEWGLFASQ